MTGLAEHARAETALPRSCLKRRNGHGHLRPDGHILDIIPRLQKCWLYPRRIGGHAPARFASERFSARDDPLEELHRGINDSVKRESLYAQDGACLWAN